MRLIFLMADAFRRYWINAERKGEQKSFVAETAQATSKWIEDNYKCEDFLLWVDTFQCHEPFDPPEYWREQHYRDYDSFPTVYPNDGPSSKYTREQMLRVNFDGETYLTSKWLGYLLRTLEDVGIHDDCFICLVSDHGTYLGEHGRSGKFLLPPEIQKSTPWPQCDELHRIPMLIKMPGQKKNAYRKHRDVARKMGRAYVRFLESVGCEAGKPS